LIKTWRSYQYTEDIHKIPQTGGVLVLSFSLTGDEIKNQDEKK
jgi:hypothetical protein